MRSLLLSLPLIVYALPDILLLRERESDQLITFLNGLNNSFELIKNQILLMDPLCSMSKAYSLLLQIEKQKEIVVSMEIGALSVEGKSPKRPLDRKKVATEKKN